MTAFSTYETGSVEIGANGTTVTGTGTNWTGNNAFPGDTIEVDGFGPVKILDVTDATHLVIKSWPFAAVSAGTSYAIFKDSSQRVTGVQQATDVNDLMINLRASGLLYYLDPEWTDPNLAKPAINADDGQGILRISTGQLWVKQGGTWVAAGAFKGFNFIGAYNATTSYSVNDVLTSDGSAYVVIAPTTGNAPPNATYYGVLASKGDQGIQGIQGASYGGTSTTSLAIGTGSKAFTTQAGMAYTGGARVRASSAADTTNWMEGIATYSGTTLTITVSKTNGSGTHADWNLNVVGEPGAGDLSSTNNLSDVANAEAALANLGGLAKDANLSDLEDASTARSNLGLTALATAAIGQLPGDTSGTTAASAGSIGEEITNTANSAAYVNNVYLTVVSITIPSAGEWEISGYNSFSGTSSTETSDWTTIISTSSTPGTNKGSYPGSGFHDRAPAGFDFALSHVFPPQTFKVTGETTLYMHAAVTYESGQGLRVYR